MTISITNTITIKEVKAAFHKVYPFLKMEFADRSHKWGEPASHVHWFDPSFRLVAIAAKKFADQTIDFHPWDNVETVEALFKDRFGLYPQVFRREEYHWIETTNKDDFNLDEQNEIGRKSLVKTRNNLWKEREALL